MRNDFDLAPFYRSSIGFDRVFSLLNDPQRQHAVDAWPRYDILKVSDSEYRIIMAVAGFESGDLDVTQERNVLHVKGGKADDSKAEYLHRGIATRGFQRRFELADHVTVENASLRNGLLYIDLKREIPEAMKPRKITIGREQTSAPLEIEGEHQVG
ncbi:Hsp20 family protein [Rhizobium sp. S163]|uniref:Hsp20 family protein n=1 Tax=Rhizobium sp. S163 TaxID=3055039 RepID=UPI0025A9BC6A|nr:Hsp20 family protein [Rhizobium sp. S163]MDM9646812.1 Hsp20 family protein [Rhizobium sp. S163]